MQTTDSRGGARRYAGAAIALILIVFGAAAVVQGIDGRSTVRDALALEHVHGEAGFTPRPSRRRPRRRA